MKPLCSTLLELLQQRAAPGSGTANRAAFTYLENGEQVSASVTFSDLDRQARKLAAHLQTLTSPGDRVLLLYLPSLDYISAFFGCVYAGVIAVPALPPSNARAIPRLRLITEDARPRIALTSSEIAAQIEKAQAGGGDVLSKLSWLTTDTAPDLSQQWTPPELRPADIVFLQYTSGSTGSPKGVMVSHANCLANAHAINTAFPLASGDSLVSWLPPHHDMGLVGVSQQSRHTIDQAWIFTADTPHVSRSLLRRQGRCRREQFFFELDRHPHRVLHAQPCSYTRNS